MQKYGIIKTMADDLYYCDTISLISVLFAGGPGGAKGVVPLVRSGEFCEYYGKVPKNFDTIVYILIKYGRLRRVVWYGTDPTVTPLSGA